jgi:hypothetical protein
MAGPVEEVTKAAGSALDALKSTPVIMALILLNVIYVGMTLYIVKVSGERWTTMIEHVFQACGLTK